MNLNFGQVVTFLSCMYVLLSQGVGQGSETGPDCHAICKQSASYMVLCYKVMT